MPHETAWAAWLAAARGMVPLEYMQPGACTWNASMEQPAGHVRPAQETIKLRRRIFVEQALFSVYVHPSPEFPGYPKDSVFYGKSVRLRVKVFCFCPVFAVMRSNLRTDEPYCVSHLAAADVWHECSSYTVSRQAAGAALSDALLNTTSGVLLHAVQCAGVLGLALRSGGHAIAAAGSPGKYPQREVCVSLRDGNPHLPTNSRLPPAHEGDQEPHRRLRKTRPRGMTALHV